MICNYRLELGDIWNYILGELGGDDHEDTKSLRTTSHYIHSMCDLWAAIPTGIAGSWQSYPRLPFGVYARPVTRSCDASSEIRIRISTRRAFHQGNGSPGQSSGPNKPNHRVYRKYELGQLGLIQQDLPQTTTREN